MMSRPLFFRELFAINNPFIDPALISAKSTQELILNNLLENNKALYVIFLATLAMTAPLATDMYLSAIPRIATGWGVGKDLVNLTLVLWFASFSVFILVSGSLSDKFGRKPVLVAGLAIFVVSSLLCAAAQNVYQLIAFRILQGMGAGAPAAIVMAIIRDRFSGRERQRALAYVMTIVAVAPMIAPLLGAFLLKIANWRFIFLLQALLVGLTLLASGSISETNKDKLKSSILSLVSRYAVHLKNRPYLYASVSMGLLLLPFYGYIAFSPIYYITLHGLSETTFSLLFGLNALVSMAGAFSSSRLTRRFDDKTIITIAIIGCIAAGTGLALTADKHYLYFLVFIAVFSFFTGLSRPSSGALILGLVRTDVGSASSLLVFYQFIAGAACMAFVTRQWEQPVLVFSLMTLSVSILVLLLWLKISATLKPVN